MRLALAALAVALGTAASGSASPAGKPALRLLERAPVTVAGSSFRPREHVRLVLTAGDLARTRYTRAGARGAFVKRFNDIAVVDRCTWIALRAIGSRGSRALRKWPPLPTCLPS